MKSKLRLIKGGPGSGGSRPGAGRPRSIGEAITPANSGRGRWIGVRPSVAYPYGRNPDGTPRTANDIRDPKKPLGSTEKPKKPKT